MNALLYKRAGKLVLGFALPVLTAGSGHVVASEIDQSPSRYSAFSKVIASAPLNEPTGDTRTIRPVYIEPVNSGISFDSTISLTDTYPSAAPTRISTGNVAPDFERTPEPVVVPLPPAVWMAVPVGAAFALGALRRRVTQFK